MSDGGNAGKRAWSGTEGPAITPAKDEAGKGEALRPTDVTAEEWARNYERTFGHRGRLPARCGHPRQVTPEGLYTLARCLDCGAVFRVEPGKKES